MPDPLKLLFELDADGEPSVKEFKRVTAAFAAEIESMKKLAASAVKLSLVQNQPAGDGAAASKSTLDSQREVNRQLEAMWSAREKEQADSLKKQSDTERAFAAQQLSTVRAVESEIAQAFKDRESQLAETAKQSEDAWAKHEDAKLSSTRQAEKESEAVVAATNAAKDKAAKIASDNFIKLQKETAAVAAKANAQTAANEIRAALIAAKGTADVSSIAAKGIEALGEHLNLLIGHRIPLAGGAFLRLSENVRGFVTLSKASEGSVLRLGGIIADLSQKTGKSAPEIKNFLDSFAKLGTQAEKDAAAISAFGPALAQKLLPQLAAADSAIKALAATLGKTGEEFTALAGPIGIAILAVAAIAVVLAGAVKGMFDLAEGSAEVSGKFQDLSQQLGVSTELLSGLDVLLATTGGDTGALSSALGIFQKHLEDAQDPMSSAAGLLQELGVQTSDTETALRQSFAALAKMPEGFKQTAVALDLFGRSGKTVLAIIKETNGDLDAALKKYAELGLIISGEDAKAADEFNDQLKLLQRQQEALTRELGKEFLPAALDVVRALVDLTKSSKGLFDIIGTVGRPVMQTFADAMKAVSIAVAVADGDIAEAIKRFKEFDEERRKIERPINVPEISSLTVPLPGPRSVLEQAREDSRLVRAEVSSAVRFAESQLSAIDQRLQLREISPAEALEPIIASEKAKTEAVIKGLNDQREAKAKEFAEDVKGRQRIADEVAAIDQQIANEQAKFDKFEADKRAEFRAQELQREQAHRRALADIFLNALNDRITAINRSAQTGANSELFAQDVTTELLKAGFEKRKQILESERAEAGKDPALAQQINAQLADLQRERTATLSQQADRRIEILREENRKALDLQRASIDSILRAGSITDSSRIATIKSLASLRVKTDEQAAREILKIRLDAIDQQKDLAEAERAVIEKQVNQRLVPLLDQRKALLAAQQTATGEDLAQINKELEANRQASIDAIKKANKDRVDADTDLGNKLRVLGAERSEVEADGDREVEQGRQDDLSNARKYAVDLQEIADRIADIQKDTAQGLIDLMRLHFARGTDIIKAQRDLDLKEEEDRHRRETERIRAQQSEVDEEIRILEKHLKAVRIGTDEEIAEKDRLIIELGKLRIKRAELNAQQDAEDNRSATRRRRTTDESQRALELEDPTSGRSLFGDVFAETEQSGSVLQGLLATGQDVFSQLSAQAGNMRDIMVSAFSGIGQAAGDAAAAFVLYGNSGTSFKKVAAQVIASVTSMALVKGIFELAEGFAALARGVFGDPKGFAEAALHFKSAAIYGIVAGIAAVAGRAVAGNSFTDNKGTASAAVNGGERTPNNRNFDSNGQAVESSSQAAREGSGGLFSRREANDRAIVDALNKHTAATLQLNSTISRLKTEPKGVVVADGLEQNPAAAGRAVLVHSNSDGDFNENLQRNLGLT